MKLTRVGVGGGVIEPTTRALISAEAAPVQFEVFELNCKMNLPGVDLFWFILNCNSRFHVHDYMYLAHGSEGGGLVVEF